MNKPGDLYIHSIAFSSEAGILRRARARLWIVGFVDIFNAASRWICLHEINDEDNRKTEFIDSTEYIEFPVLNGGLGLGPSFPQNPYVLQAFINNDKRFGNLGRLTIREFLGESE